MSTRSYTQSAKVDLDLWPKINRVSPLIIHNLHVKFESDLAKSVVTIMPTRSIKEYQSWPWPLTLWPKINRVPPLIIHNLHVKFESDWAKTVVAIVSTRSYTQSAKVDLDLWPRDPKSIGFLLSSSTTYMWSWKWLGNNLSRYRVHKVKRDGHTYARTHPPTHSLTQPPTNGRVTISLQRCCEGIIILKLSHIWNKTPSLVNIPDSWCLYSQEWYAITVQLNPPAGSPPTFDVT